MWLLFRACSFVLCGQDFYQRTTPRDIYVIADKNKSSHFSWTLNALADFVDICKAVPRQTCFAAICLANKTDTLRLWSIQASSWKIAFRDGTLFSSSSDSNLLIVWKNKPHSLTKDIFIWWWLALKAILTNSIEMNKMSHGVFSVG